MCIRYINREMMLGDKFDGEREWILREGTYEISEWSESNEFIRKSYNLLGDLCQKDCCFFEDYVELIQKIQAKVWAKIK